MLKYKREPFTPHEIALSYHRGFVRRSIFEETAVLLCTNLGTPSESEVETLSKSPTSLGILLLTILNVLEPSRTILRVSIRTSVARFGQQRSLYVQSNNSFTRLTVSVAPLASCLCSLVRLEISSGATLPQSNLFLFISID